jgi:hypothetical protein
VDDHVSKVLNALVVVGDAELVGEVNGEVRRRPGGGEGCLSYGGGFLHGGLGPYLLGGHGGFVVVPDCVFAAIIIVIVTLIVRGSIKAFLPF